jgi:hypothetical protein
MDPPGSVCHEEHRDFQGSRNTNRRDDHIRGIAFIAMKASSLKQDRTPSQIAKDELSSMPRYGYARKARDFAEWDGNAFLQLMSQGAQPRTQHPETDRGLC